MFSEQFIEKFWDKSDGAFYFTDTNTEELLGRQKQIYDGAVPSSNSVAIISLIRLSRITGRTDFEGYANSIGEYFSSDLIRSGSSITHGLQAVQYVNNSPKEIVIVDNTSPGKEILSSINTVFSPFKVCLFKNSELNDINKLAHYTEKMERINNSITFYFCSNHTCENPTNNLSQIQNLLKPNSLV